MPPSLLQKQSQNIGMCELKGIALCLENMSHALLLQNFWQLQYVLRLQTQGAGRKGEATQLGETRWELGCIQPMSKTCKYADAKAHTYPAAGIYASWPLVKSVQPSE